MPQSGYTPEQLANIRLALQLSSKHSPRVRKSLLEAMAVESNFRNVPYGDRDSEGVLQQRPSTGWGPATESARQDILQYLARATRTDRGFRGTAGQLAQAIQGSAFPERYDQRQRQANELLRSIGLSVAPERTGTPSPPATTGDPARRQAALAFILGDDIAQYLTPTDTAGPAPTPASRPVKAQASKIRGLQPDFERRLAALIAAVRAQGGTLELTSGYRDIAHQRKLWQDALRRYGSAQKARKWVAPPGKSKHNHGIAGDLRGDLELAHELAPRFGLHFPLANEDWHIEPVGSRS